MTEGYVTQHNVPQEQVREQFGGSRCAMPWQSMLIDLTGEVVPCAYYHMSSDGAALGNTNVDTIDEIWNGEGYRDLRRRHAEGNLGGHPCNGCMAFRTRAGTYPLFEWGDGFRAERGRCYTITLPQSFWSRHRHRAAEIEILEDGRPLSKANAEHEEIRRLGAGRYSVWHGALYMSSSDGTNPANNNRRYQARLQDDSIVLGEIEAGSHSAKNTVLAHTEYCAGSQIMAARPCRITFIETSDCNIDCPACNQNEVRLLSIRHRPETSPDVMAHVPFLQELIWHGGEPYLMPKF